MKKAVWSVLVVLCAYAVPATAATCTPTGFYRDNINMTAALINPGVVTGTVDATGCNIGVYYDHNGAGGTVKAAEIFGADYFGVAVNGDAGSVSVDVLDSTVRSIGEDPLNGTQHGVAIYYRGMSDTSSVTGKIAGNRVFGYQKGGIVTNGPGVQALIFENTVTGSGHVNWIAQNGIQVGYGATASVMRNTVSGNSYTGGTWVSGGILVVGGAAYGGELTVNTKITDNVLINNDVGVYVSQYEANYDAPYTATNIKVVNNTIATDLCVFYSAGVSDVGNNDKIINNKISGDYLTCGYAVDADVSFTTKPKVHANK